MGLVGAWIVRVHVPIGARSRRRPLAELRAVLAAIRGRTRAGALGAYRDVTHFSLDVERFVRPGAARAVHVPVVTVTTYVEEAARADVDALARAIAAAHPWEHPVIHCAGPDGSFVWSPER